LIKDIPSNFNTLFDAVHRAMTSDMPRHGFRIDAWRCSPGSGFSGNAVWRVTVNLYEAPYSSRPFSVDLDESATPEDVVHASETLLDVIAADRLLRRSGGRLGESAAEPAPNY